MDEIGERGRGGGMEIIFDMDFFLAFLDYIVGIRISWAKTDCMR